MGNAYRAGDAHLCGSGVGSCAYATDELLDWLASLVDRAMSVLTGSLSAVLDPPYPSPVSSDALELDSSEGDGVLNAKRSPRPGGHHPQELVRVEIASQAIEVGPVRPQ